MTERKKMAREERAKQFMPFAALKGYPEALRRKEEEILSGSGAENSEEVPGEQQLRCGTKDDRIN